MDVKETKAQAPQLPKSQTGAKKKNERVVVLRIQSMALVDNKVEKLEKKYSDKFGCKVVILESNLEMVEVING